MFSPDLFIGKGRSEFMAAGSKRSPTEKPLKHAFSFERGPLVVHSPPIEGPSGFPIEGRQLKVPSKPFEHLVCFRFPLGGGGRRQACMFIQTNSVGGTRNKSIRGQGGIFQNGRRSRIQWTRRIMRIQMQIQHSRISRRVRIHVRFVLSGADVQISHGALSLLLSFSRPAAVCQ